MLYIPVPMRASRPVATRGALIYLNLIGIKEEEPKWH